MNNKRPSVFRELYGRPYNAKITKLSETAKDDETFVQRLALLKSLPVHNGCVNTICWNEKGNLILSGSDDQSLVITNGYNYKVQSSHPTSHLANIFSAKFLPCTNDMQIVSCSGDGIILHTDLSRPQDTYYNQFNCHAATTTYEVVTIPNDPNTFLSCGEDGTVRWFDLRTKTSCNKRKCKEDILVSCSRAVTALAINPKAPHQLAAGCADSTVRIYDRRNLSTQPGEHLDAHPFCTFVAPGFREDRHYRITSLTFDNEGTEMLVSYSSDYLYLFNILNCGTTELKKPIRKPSFKAKPPVVKSERPSPPPVRRLRLRGDWSDTGPDARPERDNVTTISIGQARPQLQATLMQRMTDVLSRMLNDPMTRTALSAGGEDSVDPDDANRDIEGNSNSAGGSMDVDESNEPSASNAPQTSSSEPATPNVESGSSNVTSHLHDHLAALRNLRDGFISQHGAEPSISFRYSQQSTSNSTISLKVGNRSNPNASQPNVPSTSDGGGSSSAAMDSDMDVELDDEERDPTDSDSCNEKTETKPCVYEAEMKRKYVGHRNTRTMIKEATFWGDDYVMSGSDCGHVFVWDRHTAQLKMLLEADQHVVNCLQPHPELPILATSGIDYDVKLWAPVLEENGFDSGMAEDLIKRNAIMLEETRDTITVPAAFMIRMLACLNQIRRGARGRNRRPADES